MIKMFNFGFLLEGETTSGGNGGSLWLTLGSFALIIVFFYFVIIRPNKKREKQDAEMRDSLQVGDEVTTIGGIIGKVVSIKGETFVLETTKERTKIRFLRGAIRSIDVKAADIAAQVIGAKAEAEANAEAEAAPEADSSDNTEA